MFYKGREPQKRGHIREFMHDWGLAARALAISVHFSHLFGRETRFNHFRRITVRHLALCRKKGPDVCDWSSGGFFGSCQKKRTRTSTFPLWLFSPCLSAPYSISSSYTDPDKCQKRVRYCPAGQLFHECFHLVAVTVGLDGIDTLPCRQRFIISAALQPDAVRRKAACARIHTP
jgi:hypothetical protein